MEVNVFTLEAQSALKSAANNGYWRRADAEMVLAFWKQSGQTSLSAFAKAWGINPVKLRRWHKHLEGEDLPTFHPVAVVDKPAAPPAVQSADAAGSVDVVVGRHRVVAHPGFDDATLVRVLRLLASTC